MAHLQQFSYGWITPVLAYLFSFLGCLLGLKATGRARMASGRERNRWLILAAWALGGTGIWVMHFVAMIGFEVDGSDVKFDLPITIASWLTAIVVVGIGLFIVGYGEPTAIKVITAGVLTGVGVAGMHYTGMYAMRVNGMAMYDMHLVWLSVAIAVVAAIVALWFTVIARSTVAVVIAAAIMGAAVLGMHYTGMESLRIHLNTVHTHVTGASALTFLVPILVFVLLVVVALGYAMLNSPSERDTASLGELQSRITTAAAQPPARGGTFR
jgi:NO-binding membrane sensor protein with MHYT domain